jgi:hypothetical protein
MDMEKPQEASRSSSERLEAGGAFLILSISSVLWVSFLLVSFAPSLLFSVFVCLFSFRFCFVDYLERWRFDENLHLLKRLCAFGKGTDGLVTQNNIKME